MNKEGPYRVYVQGEMFYIMELDIMELIGLGLSSEKGFWIYSNEKPEIVKGVLQCVSVEMKADRISTTTFKTGWEALQSLVDMLTSDALR